MSPALVDLVLDLDTGTDDALALLLALRAPRLRLRAVTCVDGNVDVDRAVVNTLRVLDAVGAPEVPVARGAARPLRRRPPPRADGAHGRDGLGDLPLPPRGREAASEPAGSLLARLPASGAVTYVGCGPATNLAQLLRSDPAAVRSYAGFVVVAGRDGADFNATHDPEAFEAVVEAGLAMTFVEPDALRSSRVGPAGMAALASAPDAAARLAADLLAYRAGTRGVATIGDAVAVARLIDPTATPEACADLFVDVLTGSC